MPTPSNNSSPVKRPGLGRRAVSSHAVVTRPPSSSDKGELSQSHTSTHTQLQQKAPGHRPHRAHLVGGGHRTHGRNPSTGKNLSKLQRHLSSQYFGPETRPHYHQRKKSAPVTPVASPPRSHVKWDDDLSPRATGSIKKNYSSPALRRSNSSVLPKKALVTDRPHTSSGKKKTVGFELADSTDEGEWEDTTQSPESTRRSSVAQSRDGDETAVQPAEPLYDQLTFVKRPYPPIPRATSLPEPASTAFHGDNDDQSTAEDDDDNDDKEPVQRTQEQSSDTEEQPETTARPAEKGDISKRILSPSLSAKAPPAMSSISATATPAPVDTISRNASLTNLASGQDGLRRPMSSANIAHTGTPTSQPQGSSSIEGGVSRFINNKIATSRTDSDPNTPSSFLPHYHPQTPPSPRGVKKTRGSPSSRQPGTEPPSRTQQKLWLQRTAALNTSPPDSHGASSSGSPATMDPAYMNGTARVGAGPYDTGRALVNGASRGGGPLHHNEAKHNRKTYEKAAMELTVVRRFQSPTSDSFSRLNKLFQAAKGSEPASQESRGLGNPVKSAPALVLLQRDAKHSRSESSNTANPDSRQLMGRRQAGSQADAQDPADPPHPSQQILSTSADDAAHGLHSQAHTHGAELDHAADPFLPSESDMMIRRMWESREVASSG
ncbi:uncharacterized protein BDV14DRAFT_161774 [Aspergillus stella-maris]|uniref:uncharacterized protein n=1 Tax=Aspergillus stella-maris TaxID=1810926 RepID=UPI003CCD1ABF